jgi:PKD repeat protein
VTLTVTDNLGTTGSTTRTVQVGVTNQPPVATFTFSPANPVAGAVVTFNASGSYDPDGVITSYAWSFGDGWSGTGSTAFHAYGGSGAYTVTLTVTDNLGTTGSTTRTVQVGVTNQPPVAAFNYSPANPAPGTMVLFNASTSYDPDGVITLYTWAFGDGWSGSNPNPTVSHPYAAGTYSVTLTVTDNLGATGSVTRVVQVGTSGVPGTPVMDGIPGIFVWGSDRWHVTVNAGATWTSAHSYRIELRTDGSFLGVNQSTSGGVAPLGIVPTPTDSGKTLVFEGSLRSGSIDVTFTVAGTTKSIWMSLKLDLDGNGTLEESPSLVYLRGFMVHPPVVPFVVVRPSGTSDTFVPSMNFEIHLAHFYIVGPFGTAMWTGRLTDIATLEGLR